MPRFSVSSVVSDSHPNRPILSYAEATRNVATLGFSSSSSSETGVVPTSSNSLSSTSAGVASEPPKASQTAKEYKKAAGPTNSVKVEKVVNTSSSNSGAGSQWFHIYRKERRRELDRVAEIEKQAAEVVAQKEFEDRKRKANDKIQRLSKKRAAKRNKRKAKLLRERAEKKARKATKK